MQKACETLFDNVAEKQMYITGGVGSSHIGEAFTYNYDLPSDTAYAETCASIGMAFFCRRMLEITPSSKYADVLEREVYNGILSGMALDGKSFFYVNPLDVNPKSCHKDQRKFHVKPVRQKWFGCACCPPNLARFISSIGLYAFTETDSSLFVHLYIGANIVKRMGDVNIDISIDSNFPWEGKSTIIVKNAPKNFKLALRIPDWVENNYSLSGFHGDVSFSDGYIYLSKDWSDTEEVSIEFPMNIRIIEANTNVRELAGKVAVQRGLSFIVWRKRTMEKTCIYYRCHWIAIKKSRTSSFRIIMQKPFISWVNARFLPLHQLCIQPHPKANMRTLTLPLFPTICGPTGAKTK